MDCERARQLIDPYSTGELDLAAALGIEEHLRDCPGCAGELESVRALRGAVTGASLRYAAPAELRRRVSTDLGAAEAEARPVAAPRARTRRFAVAAAIGALLIIPCLALYWNASRTGDDRLGAEITSNHVRSLMGDHL